MQRWASHPKRRDGDSMLSLQQILMVIPLFAESIIVAMNANSGLITGLATVVLAGVTYLYLKEVQKSRIESRLPSIFVDLDYVGCGDPLALLSLRNGGKGVATDVEIKWEFKKGSKVGPGGWSYHPVLFPKDRRRFILERIRGLFKDYAWLVVDLSYCDERGQRHEKQQRIDMKKIEKWLETSKQHYEKNDLHELRREVGKLVSSFDSVVTGMHRIKVERKTYSEEKKEMKASVKQVSQQKRKGTKDNQRTQRQ